MTIYTYSNFKKKPNSTKQPTSGTTVTCTLKESTSIENPTFILAGALSSYAGVTAVRWDSRYYFVTDITSQHAGVTEISCTIDRLATFKSDIGATNAFIERCETGYDDSIMDPSASTQSTTYRDELRSDAIFPANPNQGVVALHIASDNNLATIGGGAVGIAFVEPGLFPGSSNAALYDVLAKLWNDTTSTNLKKTLNDAWSALIKAVYIPCFTCDNLTGAQFITNDLYLGKQAFSDVQIKTYSSASSPKCYEHGYEFDLTAIQQYSSFKWRNLPPYCEWHMYLPFYGPVDVPADMFLNYPAGIHPYLYVKTSVDYVTGDLVYTLYYRIYIGVNPADHLIAKYQTKIGVDIPLTNIRQGNALETVGHALGAAGALLSRDPFGVVTEGVAGVISTMKTQVSSVGNMSSGVGIATAEWGTGAPKILLYTTGHYTNAEPSTYASSIGCMFMKQDTISSHSGYIKCSNASVSTTGTEEDKEAINAMLDSGFFYE